MAIRAPSKLINVHNLLCFEFILVLARTNLSQLKSYGKMTNIRFVGRGVVCHKYPCQLRRKKRKSSKFSDEISVSVYLNI